MIKKIHPLTQVFENSTLPFHFQSSSSAQPSTTYRPIHMQITIHILTRNDDDINVVCRRYNTTRWMVVGERKETKVDEIYYYYYYDWPNESGLSSFRRSIRRRRSPLSLPLTALLYLFCSCCCTATGKLCLLPVDVVGRSPWLNSQTTCLFNYSVLIECIQEKIKMQWGKINANNILFIVFILYR